MEAQNAASAGNKKAQDSYFAWNPKDDPEFSGLIYGEKTIGGKGRSLLYALRRLRDSGDERLAKTRVPLSVYFGIDLFHAFLERVESFDKIISCGDCALMESGFLSAPLPGIMRRAVREFLSGTDDPVVVRSSSRLEDSLQHSFAGKYLSVFLDNAGGSLEERALAVENQIKRIYSRTFFPEAVSYRDRHSLGGDDMGIILIRMAGKWRGRYYYPTMAGVGYSQNFRRWSTRLKQDDGVLRIVFGMGTMSTKRGYARTISLTNPFLRPDGQNPDKIAFNAQEKFQVIDRDAPGDLTTLDIKKEWRQLIEHHNDFAAYAQIFNYSMEGGFFTSLTRDTTEIEDGSKVCLTFENFPRRYGSFFERMKKTLKVLEASMGVTADIEYAYEPEEDGLDLIQSRPFWCKDCKDGGIPDLRDKTILLQADRMVTPGNAESVSTIVYVDHKIYNSCPADHYDIARGIGRTNELLCGEPYILVAPGRVGSSNPQLGVPVRYNELTNCCCIVELGIPRFGFMPELSYGTHFFSDLEVDSVLYMPVFEGELDNIINTEWFHNNDWRQGTHPAIRIYRGDFSAFMDGEKNCGVIIDNENRNINDLDLLM